SLFIIDLMGLFFYTKIGSIISIGDLPTTNIIEPFCFQNIVQNFVPVFHVLVILLHDRIYSMLIL
ncbi:hypothetical protein ACB095_03680, partial [Streptococcus pneumoniae]|uniref:hypothetical protein n=1 Tax=Streptococcus pneumoniae TaxID=1313 RepID=UPI0035270C55